MRNGTTTSADFCTARDDFRRHVPTFGQALIDGATMTRMPSMQTSPDKNVSCPCTSSSFTWATVWERLRDDWLTRLVAPALYDISVRSLAGLGSGFLPTVGHPSAVAFASYFVNRSYPLGMLASFRLPISYRGLAPHKFTPMLGVPQIACMVTARSPLWQFNRYPI